MTNTYQTTYLKDYQPPHYKVEHVNLVFELNDAFSLVTAQLQLRANGHDGTQLPLKLQGQGLELISLSVDGNSLALGDYQLDAEELTIAAPGVCFEIKTTVRIKPQNNTSLMGLYKSNGNFCTQCEAEGFRKITYYIDRPDNLAIFTTTLIADKSHYPILLANGDKIAQGEDAATGKHWVKWHDPWSKAGHLFALVAGKFECLTDEFITLSGQQVTLQLFVEPGNLAKAGYAMHALKLAMRWDEQVYGREYDLAIFMLVAISDFNMGAMENKGLNIFNSKYILAAPETATDADFENILRVVGHEYFHNWSGNRVGCRDWFQLSLKEGFTVFRDQSFTAAMTSAAVKRIDEVKLLRTAQFAEDAGPLAHAVRPASYMEINNFYTVTVYEKGAELIRMLHLLLGEKLFRCATDLYFSRFDGKVATTDDFINCMQEASGIDLSQFQLWYSQAGTPEVQVRDEYDAKKQEYRLSIQQHTPATPGQLEKFPLLIPLKIGLLDEQGNEVAARLAEVKHTEQCVVFTKLPSKPTPSLLRGFSAPINLHYDYSDAQLELLLTHDRDYVNRWEAAQLLTIRQLQSLVHALQQQQIVIVDPNYIATLKKLIDAELEPAFKALLLTLPTQAYVAEFIKPIDPLVIHQAHTYLQGQLAQQLRESWLALYQRHHERGTYQQNQLSNGHRALKNVALSYLLALKDADLENIAYQQYQHADNMTDRFAAFALLVNNTSLQRSAVIADFYVRFNTEPLVLDKWFAAQAASRLPDTLKTVKALWQDPAFNEKNPNKVRALITSFTKHNPANFHQLDGAGYKYLAELVLHIDTFNPQLAARLLEPLTAWRRYQAHHANLMQAQLQSMLTTPALSKDSYEVLAKALG